MVKKMRPSQVVFGIAVLVVLSVGIRAFLHRNDAAVYASAKAVFGRSMDAAIMDSAHKLLQGDHQGAEAANTLAIQQVYLLLDAAPAKFRREIILNAQTDATTEREWAIKECHGKPLQIEEINRNYNAFIAAINKH